MNCAPDAITERFAKAEAEWVGRTENKITRKTLRAWEDNRMHSVVRVSPVSNYALVSGFAGFASVLAVQGRANYLRCLKHGNFRGTPIVAGGLCNFEQEGNARIKTTATDALGLHRNKLAGADNPEGVYLIAWRYDNEMLGDIPLCDLDIGGYSMRFPPHRKAWFPREVLRDSCVRVLPLFAREPITLKTREFGQHGVNILLKPKP